MDTRKARLDENMRNPFSSPRLQPIAVLGRGSLRRSIRRAKEKQPIAERFLRSFFRLQELTPHDFSEGNAGIFSANVFTVTLDHRGTNEYHGIDQSVRGLFEWAAEFRPKAPHHTECLVESLTRAFVKVHGDVECRDSMGRFLLSKADAHQWSLFFEWEEDRIIKLEIRFQRDRIHRSATDSLSVT